MTCSGCKTEALLATKLERTVELLIKDWTAEEQAIRNALRPYMDVDGDSHSVPSVVDLVQRAAELLKEKGAQ